MKLTLDHNYSKLKELFDGMEPIERQMFIYSLLLEGSIDYVQISEQYVETLKKIQEVQGRKLNNTSLRLVNTWQHIPAKEVFKRAATAYTILNSNIVEGALLEKELEQYLVEHPYSEDEYGFPIFSEDNVQRA